MDKLLATDPATLALWLALGAAAGLAFANVLTLLGRLLALRYPRVGEVLIRSGSDFKGSFEAMKLPPGTPSVSAQPVDEAAKAIVESPAGPSVAPPPRPDAEAPGGSSGASSFPRDPKLPPMV